MKSISKKIFAGLLCSSIVISPIIATPPNVVKAAEDTTFDQLERTDTVINNDWTFTFGKDASTSSISLPHTWNTEDGSNGPDDNDDAGNSYYRGTSTYERTIDVSDYHDGKVFLKFDGANKETSVYIDGDEVGQHQGGYAAFTFDITDYIAGKESVELKVDVDNANTTTIIPLGSPDYTQWGGIYRDVHIINTSDAYFSLESDSTNASSGLFFNQSVTNIADGGVTGKIGDAALTITANVTVPAASDYQITAKVFDMQGNLVQQSATNFSAVEGNNQVDLNAINIADANLWNGIQNGVNKAYLYRVYLTLSDANGNDLDQLMDRVGFRTFDVLSYNEAQTNEANGGIGAGFKLNDEEYLLRGVSTHQDFAGKGNAINDADWDKSFALMEEMGVNFIRAAHYQYDDYFYSQADMRGIVTWAEIPNTNSVPTDYEDANNTVWGPSQANAIQQLKEMITQLYNHASIAVWCVENQTGTSNGTNEKVVSFIRDMQEVAHELDASREVSLTTLATQGFDSGITVDNNGGNTGLVDAPTGTYYYGWYKADPASLGDYINLVGETYPDMAYGISEYGAGAVPSNHQVIADSQIASGRSFSFPTHPQEWQNIVHEENYRTAVEPNNWLWSTAVWNMFDFGSDSKKEGDPSVYGQNDKGLVTYDRERKKDTFFYYKAKWNKTEDFVHIASGDYLETLNPADLENGIDVKVYTNAQFYEPQYWGDLEGQLNKSLELRINGELFTDVEPVMTQPGVLVWKNVNFTPSVIDSVYHNDFNVSVFEYVGFEDRRGEQLAASSSNSDYGVSPAELLQYDNREYVELDPVESVDPVDPVSGEAKNIVNMNQDWQFAKEGGEPEAIDLPHTWNKDDGYGDSSDYYRGLGTYEKTIDVSHYQNKNVMIKFDGSSIKTTLFVDNQQAGEPHIGGYNAFVYDITNLIQGKDNVTLRVEVTNEKQDAPPLSGDFTVWGGIYRDVNMLIASNDVYISTEDYGSTGVFVTPKVTGQISQSGTQKTADATLDVKTDVTFKGDETGPVLVRAIVRDAEGQEIARNDSAPVSRAGGSNGLYMTAVSNPQFSLQDVKLWDGIQNGVNKAYLYTIETQVLGGTDYDTVLDSQTTETGFRKYVIDADNGFFLNDQSYPLRGVAMHQDRKGYGDAVPDEVKAEDFDLIKEIGANTLRLAHNPHSQYTLIQADKNGLVVWSEISLVNSMNATQEFEDNTVLQLTEMIKQNYNHPSIAVWGLENEFSSVADEATALMSLLATKAKELDPTRLTTHAVQGNSSFNPNGYAETLAFHLNWSETAGIDVASLNTYFGWYYNHVEEFGQYLDDLHAQYPDVPLGISEYGGGANPAQHQDIDESFINEFISKRQSRGPWQPEEFQNYLHENDYKIISERPWLWQTALWNMFDFGVGGKNEASTPGINTKGLVTDDRQVKKDAFYFYKAQWNKTDDFVYITSRRYTERPTDTIQVKAYSNMPGVELTVNGKSYGQGTKQQDGVFLWEDVRINKTGNNVQVRGLGSNDLPTQVTDSVNTWIVKDSDALYALTNSPVIATGLGHTTTVTVTKGNAQRLQTPTLLVMGMLANGTQTAWTIMLPPDDTVTTDISVGNDMQSLQVFLLDGAVNWSDTNFTGLKGNKLSIIME